MAGLVGFIPGSSLPKTTQSRHFREGRFWCGAEDTGVRERRVGQRGEECLKQTEALCLLSFCENWATFVNSKYWFRGPLPFRPPLSGQHPKLPCTYTQLQLFLARKPALWLRCKGFTLWYTIWVTSGLI